MYAVEVRDRIMIAHSLPDPFFGPAQKMHGATFVVDVAFFRETLTKQNVVVDIGAALDVLKDEPEVPPQLLAMENVIVVPHIGSTIMEIREERARNVVGNLRAHFAGEPLLTPVDLSRYDRSPQAPPA